MNGITLQKNNKNQPENNFSKQSTKDTGKPYDKKI
jgi:hypothetical protein